MNSKRWARAVMAWALAWAWGALAQVPGAVQPGQIERQFQAPPQPRAQPGTFQVPETRQQPPADAAAIRFTLAALEVVGATVYDAATLQGHYASLLGREVSLADIYGVAQALTTRYRNDGYILSQVLVPAQEVADGRLRLQAVEGHVARVRLQGEGSDHPLLQAYAARIEAARPLTAGVLERYLLLMNDLPGAFARATLVPSPQEQGAAELVVEFVQRRASGGLGVDNRGGRVLGPWRLSGDVEWVGLLGRQERTGLRAVSTLDRELDYFAVNHDQPLGSEGARLAFSVGIVRAQPEDLGLTIVPLNLETASESATLAYSRPLRRSRAENLYLRAALTAHDGETELFGVRDSRDRIRALRLGLTWDLADAARGINIVDLEFSQGLRGLGSSRNDDPFLSRSGGNVDFSKLALYAARLQALAPRWSVLAALSAQYAFADLLAPELYSVGGEQFGRAYDPSELVGDHGAAAKLELRYTRSTALPALAAYTAYGFYDGGFVRQRSPGGLAASESLASAGLGLRLSFGPALSGVVELAKPLTRDVAAEGDRAARGYLGLALRF